MVLIWSLVSRMSHSPQIDGLQNCWGKFPVSTKVLSLLIFLLLYNSRLQSTALTF